MKKLSLACMIALAAFAFQACGDNNHDADDNAIGSNAANGNSDGMMNPNDSMGMGNATGSANTVDRSNLDEAGKFMVEAASGGQMEVELGNLAKEKATNQSVKDFGAMMVTDHSKANDELKSLAATKNVTLPMSPEGEHQEHINDLKNKTGSEFDKDYIDMMVKDHKEDVDKFEDMAKNSDNADVKAFASKTLPVLKKHLAEAKRIQDQLKK